MKEIIVKLEPFIFKQTVFLKEDDNIIQQAHVPQKDLAKFLSSQKSPDIIKIHIFGNKNFAEKLKEECATKYNLQRALFSINK